MSDAATAFDACYRTARRRQPSLRGVVVVRIVIGRDGRVVEAIPEVEQLSAGACSCIVDRIRDLRFPSPRGGRAVFHWPFAFGE